MTLVERLRELRRGEHFIGNTADRAWQKWMADLVNGAWEAADRIEALEGALRPLAEFPGAITMSQLSTARDLLGLPRNPYDTASEGLPEGMK